MNEPYELEGDREDQRLRAQLRRAVRSETSVPPFLEARIRNTIRASGVRPSRVFRLAPFAAAAAICIGVVIAYQLGHLRLTINSQESYITSVSNQVATLMRAGLGNHIHCAVYRKFPKDAPKVEEVASRLRGEYKELIPIVRKQVPAEYRLMLAHECGHRGRKFVHLAWKGNSKLLSLVIARKSEGESYQTEGLIPALVQAGVPVYRAGVQRFQIASFESRDYLVYCVSDLNQQRNTELMLALSGEVGQLLRRLES